MHRLLGGGRRENAAVEVGHDSGIDMKKATIVDTKGLIITVDDAAQLQVALNLLRWEPPGFGKPSAGRFTMPYGPCHGIPYHTYRSNK